MSTQFEKPISTHWADVAAFRLIKERGDKETYNVASGITPSGLVHVGNFREVITVDLVKRSLEKMGKKVRFIYSWDNFDTFRKVPVNLPDPKAFEPYLFQPIARIPDPWGEYKSYAEGRTKLFESELTHVGVAPQFIYQEKMYATHKYAKEIIHALENVDKIKAVLNKHRTSPLEDSWLPTSVYCAKCSKDKMKKEEYLGKGQYSYACETCGHEETFDINTSSNIKLTWRLDWPMRWHYEQIDFEPGGKDHSSRGGSFDTGKELIEVLWGEKAPIYLQYDFVMIKGLTGKMSSSKGELYTLSDVLKVIEPEMVRWLFASQRPNHDFSIAFDEDVIKLYEEFDRDEKKAFDLEPKRLSEVPQLLGGKEASTAVYALVNEERSDAANTANEVLQTASKNQLTQRTYELSMIDAKMPEVLPMRASFRMLCTRIQLSGGDINRCLKRYYENEIKTELDIKRFHSRATRAIFWLENYAPKDFVYKLYNKEEILKEQTFNDFENQVIAKFKDIISTLDVVTMDSKAIQEVLWKDWIHFFNKEGTELYTIIYRRLVSREQGPRLPGFIKEIGKEKLLEIL